MLTVYLPLTAIPRVIASPLCAALHSEYNVSICPPVLAFSIVRVYYRLACFFCFVSALLCLFPLDWVFLTSLSGGIVFRIRCCNLCNLYPGAAPFCFPFSLLSGRPRTGSATTFLFSRWIIDHKVDARSVNVMNTHTHTHIRHKPM